MIRPLGQLDRDRVAGSHTAGMQRARDGKRLVAELPVAPRARGVAHAPHHCRRVRICRRVLEKALMQTPPADRTIRRVGRGTDLRLGAG